MIILITKYGSDKQEWSKNGNDNRPEDSNKLVNNIHYNQVKVLVHL